MGCWLAFFALVLLAGGAFAWRHLSRQAERQKEQIDALETRLVALAADFETLRTAGPVERSQAAALEAEPAAPAAAPEATEPSTATVFVPEPAAAPPEQPPTTTMPPPAAPAAPPPPERPPRPAAAPPPSPPRPRIEWERWIGVRGAAVLGAVVLALAAILFLRYSIEAGLISPPLRVVLGILAGIGAIVGSEPLRRRGYAITANGLAGAGLVTLYASIWAARNLYQLVGMVPAFVVFVVITVAGGALSWRHRSLVIALLGLVGGFLTPILIASDVDSPLALFSYLLLLNAGLSLLARRMGWPWLTLLGLCGTVLYQVVWVFFDMDPRRAWIGLVVLGAFGAFFVLTGARRREDVEARPRSRLAQLLTQAGGVLTPLFLALYFAANADLRLSLVALAALLLPLAAAAAWLARVHRLPGLEIAAAAATLGVTVAWLGRADSASGAALQLAVVSVALALLHHLFAERDARAADGARRSRLAALPTWVAAGGMLALLAVLPGAALADGELEPLRTFWIALAGWAVLATILLRSSELHRFALPAWTAGAFAGCGFALPIAIDEWTSAGAATIVVGASLVFGVALAAWAIARRRDGVAPPGAETAAALQPLLLLGSFVASEALRAQGAAAYHLLAGACALLVLLAALRRPRGLFVAAVAVVWAVVAAFWTSERGASSPVLALALQAASAALVTCWPWPWRRPIPGLAARAGAALAGPLFYASAHVLFTGRFGEGAIGILPLSFAGIALFGATLAAQRLSGAERTSALAWLGAVALGFVALAVPLQLDKEWITIGWALQGALVVLLWRRLDHPGLKYFAALLFAAVFVRLGANPAVLDEYPASLFASESTGGLPILNWLLYTYLVPVAALLYAARELRAREAARLRAWEAALYPPQRPPLLAHACGFAALLLVFVWLNLSLIDAFTPAGEGLALTWDRAPARDLSLSLGWAVYAIGLLVLGVGRRIAALRWLSLAFFVLTIGKVFLYDLGELTDLYRVASLVGLAGSLIFVSLLYQRFVFRPAATAEAAPQQQPPSAPEP